MPKRTKLVIEGDLVTKIVEESGTNHNGSSWAHQDVIGTIRLEELLEQLMASRGSDVFTPHLTEGHLLAQKSAGRKSVYLIEFRPGFHRIIESIDQRDNRLREVAFPWFYILVVFKGIFVDQIEVYYRNERALHLDEELFYTNLPNIFDDGHVCTGSMSGIRENWLLNQKLDWIVRSFWDSYFNKDLNDNFWNPARRNIAGHPQNFGEWEELSKIDPNFVLELEWRSTGKTIRELMEARVQP